MTPGLSVLTHDGQFHADEVLGVALIHMVLGPVRLTRTRDGDLIREADVVLDVGGEFDPARCRFDHHQKSYCGEEATAGLVLNWLTDSGHVDPGFADYLRHHLVRGVDLLDQGLQAPTPGIFSYSSFIHYFNLPDTETEAKGQDQAFEEAVRHTEALLRRMRDHYRHLESCRLTLRSYLERRKQMPHRVLVLDEKLAWQEALLGEDDTEDIDFVVYPVKPGKWMLHTVPLSPDQPYSNRRLLPAAWAGLLEKEFAAVCLIPDAVFCHKKRFVAAFGSREGALKAVVCLDPS